MMPRSRLRSTASGRRWCWMWAVLADLGGKRSHKFAPERAVFVLHRLFVR